MTIDKAVLDMIPEITATAEADEYEKMGYCSQPYTVTLTIGDETHEIHGWRLVGWLAPGAHADLDGSGLGLWGDSQPGGWTWCHGDGQCSGRVRVVEPRAYVQPDHDEAIEITGGEGCGDIQIAPSEVQAWRDAIASDNEPLAEAIREALVERLTDAIDGAVDSIKSPEPESSDIYYGLDEIDGLSEMPLRLGDYLGAGVVLAWRVRDGYYHAYWPDRRDIDQALGETLLETVDVIECEIKRLTDRD